jgi:hypothetical protein
MKKNTSMFLTFTALMAINAFAPHYFWNQTLSSSRAPSSLEEDRLEELAIKEKQLAEAEVEAKKKADQEAKSKDTVRSCTANVEKVSLDQELKKLIADKEAILKEIADLKDEKKKASEVAKNDKEKELPKKSKDKEIKEPRIASIENNSQDLIAVMSSLTSLMVSQQQQQMLMMTQMYSMMAQPRMQREQSPYEIIQQYVSPYAFSHSSLPYERPDYSLANHARNIGLRFGYQNVQQQPEQAQISGPGLKMPSQEQMGSGYQLIREPSSNQGLKLNETLQHGFPVNHDGFDFTKGPTSNFQRNYFN